MAAEQQQSQQIQPDTFDLESLPEHINWFLEVKSQHHYNGLDTWGKICVSFRVENGNITISAPREHCDPALLEMTPEQIGANCISIDPAAPDPYQKYSDDDGNSCAIYPDGWFAITFKL